MGRILRALALAGVVLAGLGAQTYTGGIFSYGPKASMPAECMPGDAYSATDALPGTGLYLARQVGAACVWTQQTALLGATPDAMLTNLLTAVHAAGGGLADARSLSGTQALAATVTLPSDTTLLLGAVNILHPPGGQAFKTWSGPEPASITYYPTPLPAGYAVASGVAIIGSGEGVTVITTPGGVSPSYSHRYNAIELNSALDLTNTMCPTNVTIEEMTLEGNKGGITAPSGGAGDDVGHNGIFETCSSNLKIFHVTARDYWFEGVALGLYAHHPMISDTSTYNNGYPAIGAYGGILGSYLDQCEFSGIHSYGDFIGAWFQESVNNCHVQGDSADSGDIGLAWTETQNAAGTGNTVDWQATTAQGSYAINISGVAKTQIIGAAYVSGVTATGTGTCEIDGFNGGGSGASALLVVNAGAIGATAPMFTYGFGFTTTVSTATLAGVETGTAACTGSPVITAVISTVNTITGDSWRLVANGNAQGGVLIGNQGTAQGTFNIEARGNGAEGIVGNPVDSVLTVSVVDNGQTSGAPGVLFTPLAARNVMTGANADDQASPTQWWPQFQSGDSDNIVKMAMSPASEQIHFSDAGTGNDIEECHDGACYKLSGALPTLYGGAYILQHWSAITDPYMNFFISGAGNLWWGPASGAADVVLYRCVAYGLCLGGNDSFYPTVDNYQYLGSAAYRWARAYATEFYGDLSGTINGGAVPASAALAGTNSSGQFVANTGTIANPTSGNAATATAVLSTAGNPTHQYVQSSNPTCTQIGDWWYNTTTTTTVAQVCLNVAGTLTWVVK